MATMTVEDRTMGQRIRFARIWRGSQSMAAFGEAVAAAEGRPRPYNASAVSDWEKDRTPPSIRTLSAIANVSGLRVEWITYKSGDAS